MRGLIGLQNLHGALRVVPGYNPLNSPTVLHSPADDGWDGKLRRVYDADGVEIRNLITCDTSTGECIQQATNNGVIITHFGDSGEEEVLLMRQLHKAPLQVVVVEG